MTATHRRGENRFKIVEFLTACNICGSVKNRQMS